MALKATIFKAQLNIADFNRNYFADHHLTLARHPSETDERMLLRLVSFALYADEQLQFTRGLSTDDEPDLWQKNLNGDIQCWIDLGMPDERRIRKACARAEQVVIISYGGQGAETWWQKIQPALSRFDNLQVQYVAATELAKLTPFCQRNMQWQISLTGNELSLNDAQRNTTLEVENWLD